MKLNKAFYLTRRFLLKHLVPAWYWPKHISIDGADIPLRHAPYTFGTKWILRKNVYELAERIILKDILLEGAKVIEMGGSIGVLTSIISNKVGGHGYVVSVEASSRITQYSKKWLEALGNIKVETGFAFPVYEAPSTLQINSFDESAGSLGGVVDFTQTASSVQKQTQVFDLKTIIEKHNIQPDILVIDIEGSESIVQTVSPNFPSSVKNILIELHPGLYKNGEAEKQSIIKAICREGFTLTRSESESYLFVRNNTHAGTT
jgi:FkbM family methyltransferase